MCGVKSTSSRRSKARLRTAVRSCSVVRSSPSKRRSGEASAPAEVDAPSVGARLGGRPAAQTDGCTGQVQESDSRSDPPPPSRPTPVGRWVESEPLSPCSCAGRLRGRPGCPNGPWGSGRCVRRRAWRGRSARSAPPGGRPARRPGPATGASDARRGHPQVTPLPQPSSCGRSCQCKPYRSTYRMPLSAARCRR